MMRPKRRVCLLGPTGAGKKTLIGNLLYKCNGVDLKLLSALEKIGARKYDQLLPALASMAQVPTFDTPKNMFSINSTDSLNGTILIVAFDSVVDGIHLDDELRTRPLQCAVTQMDRAAWGQEAYQKQVKRVEEQLSRDKQTGPVVFVAVDGLRGTNILEIPERTTTEQTAVHQPDKTLIDCLDMAFSS